MRGPLTRLALKQLHFAPCAPPVRKVDAGAPARRAPHERSPAAADPSAALLRNPPPLPSRYTEFSVEGGAAIHLTGYYMPEFETGERAAGGGAGCALRCELEPPGAGCRRAPPRQPALLLGFAVQAHRGAALQAPSQAPCCCELAQRLLSRTGGAGTSRRYCPAGTLGRLCTQPVPAMLGAAGEDDSDEEGGFPPGQLLGYDEYGMPVLADQYDSDEDSDYETEGGLPLAGVGLGSGCLTGGGEPPRPANTLARPPPTWPCTARASRADAAHQPDLSPVTRALARTQRRGRARGRKCGCTPACWATPGIRCNPAADSDDDEEMGSEDEDGDLNPPRRVVIEDVTVGWHAPPRRPSCAALRCSELLSDLACHATPPAATSGGW